MTEGGSLVPQSHHILLQGNEDSLDCVREEI